MTVRLYADGFRCAIYEEAPGGGDPLDPSSLMNRPVLAPLSWLPNVYFHSDFHYYPVALSGTATISHAAVPGAVINIGQDIYAHTLFYGQRVVADHLLFTHNLGYVPRFFVAYDGKMIPHGMPVQADSAGWRLVSAYATSTQIRLRELGISTDQTLGAVSRNYQALVFRQSAADPLLPELRIEPGDVIFGQGKFRAAEPHLRATGLGDVVFAQAKDRTAAVRNGALRMYPPNGSPVDVGSFTGSLPAPAYINVAAGV